LPGETSSAALPSRRHAAAPPLGTRRPSHHRHQTARGSEAATIPRSQTLEQQPCAPSPPPLFCNCSGRAHIVGAEVGPKKRRHVPLTAALSPGKGGISATQQAKPTAPGSTNVGLRCRTVIIPMPPIIPILRGSRLLAFTVPSPRGEGQGELERNRPAQPSRRRLRPHYAGIRTAGIFSLDTMCSIAVYLPP